MPVGRIQYLQMGPMDYEEYLLETEPYAKDFLDQYNLFDPIPDTMHTLLMRKQREYLFIGGMPEAVQIVADEKSLAPVGDIHDSIISTYYDDFGKALPELKLRVKANLRTQKVRYFEYGETYRRYLFLKYLFLEEDCPDFEKQEMFDRTIMKLGIQISPTLGPDAYVFDRFLTGKKVQVSEFQLVSAA